MFKAITVWFRSRAKRRLLGCEECFQMQRNCSFHIGDPRE